MHKEINYLAGEIHRIEKDEDGADFIFRFILGIACFVFAVGLALYIEGGVGLGAMAGAAFIGVPMGWVVRSKIVRLNSLRSQINDINMINEHESRW